MLSNILQTLEDYMVDRENPVSLDYIISKKKSQTKNERPEKLEFHRNMLTVQLKNAVMLHIVKYRELNLQQKAVTLVDS